jgi:hypothetical protein
VTPGPTRAASRPALIPFQTCGLLGFALGTGVTALLARATGGPAWSALAMAGVAAVTFLSLAMITKVLRGEERLVFYHHAIALTGVLALGLRLAGQPALPQLDRMIVGLCVFLVFGRLGCFSAGCCHGRPHARGVRYGEAHVTEGFPSYLEGVSLFPIQIAEAAWALLVSVLGAIALLRGAAGDALEACTCAYALGRFCLEFHRGDPDRPFLLRFSEAQWTSLILSWIVAAAAALGALPPRPWGYATAVLITAIAAAAALHRRRQPIAMDVLMHPRHVREIAAALAAQERPSAGEGRVLIACTSRGVQLSSGRIGGPSATRHYTLSSREGGLTAKAAVALATLIVRLRHRAESYDLVASRPGVYHLVVAPSEAIPAREASIASDGP